MSCICISDFHIQCTCIKGGMYRGIHLFYFFFYFVVLLKCFDMVGLSQCVHNLCFEQKVYTHVYIKKNRQKISFFMAIKMIAYCIGMFSLCGMGLNNLPGVLVQERNQSRQLENKTHSLDACRSPACHGLLDTLSCNLC